MLDKDFPPPDIPIVEPTGTARLMHVDALKATEPVRESLTADTEIQTLMILLSRTREHYTAMISRELIQFEQQQTLDTRDDPKRHPLLHVHVNGTILLQGTAVHPLGKDAMDINELQQLSREGNTEATKVFLRVKILLEEYGQRVEKLARREALARERAAYERMEAIRNGLRSEPAGEQGDAGSNGNVE